MKIFTRNSKSRAKELALEDKRIIIQLSDDFELELHEADDNRPSIYEKGLVITAIGDRHQIVIKPIVSNSIIIDLEE